MSDYGTSFLRAGRYWMGTRSRDTRIDSTAPSGVIPLTRCPLGSGSASFARVPLTNTKRAPEFLSWSVRAADHRLDVACAGGHQVVAARDGAGGADGAGAGAARRGARALEAPP